MAKKEAPAITGSVLKGGRMYKAGDEAALAKVLPAADIARLTESGQLSGDWSGSAAGGEGEGQGEELEEVGLPKLADLPAHLQTLTTTEEVQALQASDERKGAVAHYEARLAELTED